MDKKISNMASVDKNAVIGKNVTIGPFSVIEENVKIGDNTVIGPNVHITGWTDIGKNCEIHSGAVIGDKPQDVSYKGDKSFVIIGDNNIIRESATIHRGTQANSKTVIGNNNMFMAYSHVAHNCTVGDKVILVNSVSLGGYVEVDNNAFISAVSQVHQFCKIGKYVMVGPLTKVVKDIPPYLLVTGSEIAKVRGLNVVGLRRAGFSAEERELIKTAYKILYHSNLNTSQALEKMKDDKVLKESPTIKEFIEFIEKSDRGIAAHY